MIGDAQEHVDGSTRPRTATFESLNHVRNQPAIKVSLSELPEQYDRRHAPVIVQIQTRTFIGLPFNYNGKDRS